MKNYNQTIDGRLDILESNTKEIIDSFNQLLQAFCKGYEKLSNLQSKSANSYKTIIKSKIEKL